GQPDVVREDGHVGWAGTDEVDPQKAGRVVRKARELGEGDRIVDHLSIAPRHTAPGTREPLLVCGHDLIVGRLAHRPQENAGHAAVRTDQNVWAGLDRLAARPRRPRGPAWLGSVL